MLLDHAKVKYEDCRITQEAYGAMKQAGKVNGLPVWEENGQMFNESKALIRYLAACNGYYPKDAMTAYKADKIVDKFTDVLQHWVPTIMKGELDAGKFQEGMMMIAERLSEDLKHGKPFLCGDKICVADFAAFGILASWLVNDAFPFKAAIEGGRDEVMQKFPLFAAWMMCMKKENADHLAKSPVAPF